MAKAQGDKKAETAIKRAIEEVNQAIVKGITDDKDGEEKTDGKIYLDYMSQLSLVS